MSKIAVYRDWDRDSRQYARVTRRLAADHPLGWLVKPRPGQCFVLETALFNGRMAIAGDANDLANLQLVEVNTFGEPLTPPTSNGHIGRGANTSPGSATVYTDTSKNWAVNAFAGMHLFVRSGPAANVGVSRLIASNTATAITAAAFGAANTTGDEFSVQEVASIAVTPIQDMWRQQVRVAEFHTQRNRRDLEIVLGQDKGIGWYSRTLDNFSGALDLVPFAEFNLLVAGRWESAGKYASGTSGLYQPMGGT